MCFCWALGTLGLMHSESLRFITWHQFNTMRPRQNARHFADDTFNRIFVKEIVRISIKFSLKFVPKGPINNITALFQIIAWRRPGDKPLSEPVMVSLLTHICVTRPQWVKTLKLWGTSYLGLDRSISLLLMPWLLASPGPQESLYCLCRINRPWSYLRNDFNYLCHSNVDELHEM